MPDGTVSLSAELRMIAQQVEAHTAAGLRLTLHELSKLAGALGRAAALARVLERRLEMRAADELRRISRSSGGEAA